MFCVTTPIISQEVAINLQPEEEEEPRVIDVKKPLRNFPILNGSSQGWSVSKEQTSNIHYIVSSALPSTLAELQKRANL